MDAAAKKADEKLPLLGATICAGVGALDGLVDGLSIKYASYIDSGAAFLPATCEMLGVGLFAGLGYLLGNMGYDAIVDAVSEPGMDLDLKSGLGWKKAVTGVTAAVMMGGAAGKAINAVMTNWCNTSYEQNTGKKAAAENTPKMMEFNEGKMSGDVRSAGVSEDGKTHMMVVSNKPFVPAA